MSSQPSLNSNALDTSPQAQIRVLIVDDHQLVRMGLCKLIEGQPGMKVVGEAVNCAEALTLATSANPDLILLEIDLGNDNGLDFLAKLREMGTEVRVLILTDTKDLGTQRRAAKLGAAGLVFKDQPTDLLLKAIQKVHQGEIWLDRSMMSSLLTEKIQSEQRVDGHRDKIDSLSTRERQIITLIAEGRKNKEIAATLFISETTVTHHLSSIFSKLGVSDRLQLALYALTHGLATLLARPFDRPSANSASRQRNIRNDSGTI